jgi:hypothetical protein
LPPPSATVTFDLRAGIYAISGEINLATSPLLTIIGFRE